MVRDIEAMIDTLGRGLNPPRTPQAVRERQALIGRAATLRANVRQILNDVDSWNDNARQPGEAPIDADPDGLLRRLLAALDAFLDGEVL